MAQPEYEDALRYVDMQAGWRVLDAGCGGGGFVPLIAEQVGQAGKVVALDLAPENVARVKALAREHPGLGTVEAHVGGILSLPFADAEFDCVWSANVMQYLTEAEFDRAVSEFKRVLKRGGTLAIKDSDATHLEYAPPPPGLWLRFLQARQTKVCRGRRCRILLRHVVAVATSAGGPAQSSRQGMVCRALGTSEGRDATVP
jgi:ubiquinone/menaquinone biosynthesis C-methylase UbiE